MQRILITILILFFIVPDLTGQKISSQDYKVYSDFLTEQLKNRKNKKEEITQLIIIDRTESKVMGEGLNSSWVLSSNNNLYRLNQKDSTWLNLLLFFEQDSLREYEFENQFSTDFSIKLVRSEIVNSILKKDSRKWRWKKFYKTFPKSNGIITLSRISYNEQKNKLAFYYGHSSNHLSGGGYILLMEKVNNIWVIVAWLELWVS